MLGVANGRGLACLMCEASGVWREHPLHIGVSFHPKAQLIVSILKSVLEVSTLTQ